jgi:hypothetical protein
MLMCHTAHRRGRTGRIVRITMPAKAASQAPVNYGKRGA